ncbi:UNVERIFIED_CONTAM: hypothetical protein Sindi_2601300 [Sesamum indicum]
MAFNFHILARCSNFRLSPTEGSGECITPKSMLIYLVLFQITLMAGYSAASYYFLLPTLLISLMQERGFDGDPVANLVVGLAFSQLWYSGIPKELQLTEPNSSGTYKQSEIPVNGIHMPIDYSKENDAVEAGGANSPLQCDSNTSVANDKDLVGDDGDQQKDSMDVDDNVKKETSYTSFQPQGCYMRSAEASGNSDYSMSNYSSDLPHASIFYNQGDCLLVYLLMNCSKVYFEELQHLL